MSKNMKTFHMLTYLLVIVGAINWGVVGLFNVNLVNMLLGGLPVAERMIYILIGLSAIYDLVGHMAYCKYCSGKKK